MNVIHICIYNFSHFSFCIDRNTSTPGRHCTQTPLLLRLTTIRRRPSLGRLLLGVVREAVGTDETQLSPKQIQSRLARNRDAPPVSPEGRRQRCRNRQDAYRRPPLENRGAVWICIGWCSANP